MESNDVGRVWTEAKFENLKDLWAIDDGSRPATEVRSVTVTDALVDTGATLLSMPATLIQKLGLMKYGSRQVRSSTGTAVADMYAAVRLTIAGRSCMIDVMEVPDGTPVLIGQIPLEHLDFVVDMRNHKLIGNPAHGGEHMYELY